MAKAPVVVTADDYLKDPDGIQRIETRIPGFPDAEPLITYVKVEHLDDVTPAVTDDVQTLRFSVPEWVEPVKADEENDVEAQEGFWRLSHREIDLGKKNRDALLKALEKYTNASREIQAPVPAVAAKRSSGTSNPELADWNKRVRVWLNQSSETPVKKNEEVPDRGRIKSAWEEAYVVAHPTDPKPGSEGTQGSLPTGLVTPRVGANA